MPSTDQEADILMVNCCCCPTVSVDTWGLMARSIVTPIPVSDTNCGLVMALSVIVIAPLRVPVVVGVKVIVIVQFLEPANTAGQLFFCAKSPLDTILVMSSVAKPLLVRVTDCAGLVVATTRLPKVRLGGDRLTAGAAPE